MVLGQYWIASTILPGSEPVAKQRLQDLHQMFGAKDVSRVIAIVMKYHINYLYFGPNERRLYPQFLGLVESAPSFFKQVYSKDEVHIFAVDLDSASSSQEELHSRSLSTGGHR